MRARLRAESRRAEAEALDKATDPRTSTYAALTEPPKTKDRPKQPRGARVKPQADPRYVARLVEAKIDAKIAEFTDRNIKKAIARVMARGEWVRDSDIFNCLCKGFMPRVSWHPVPSRKPTDRLLVAFTLRIVEFWRDHPGREIKQVSGFLQRIYLPDGAPEIDLSRLPPDPLQRKKFWTAVRMRGEGIDV
jgi:hypothetical protein